MKNPATDPSKGLVALHLGLSLLVIGGVLTGFAYKDRHGYYMLSAIPIYVLLGYLFFQSAAVLYHSIRILIQK
jgi:hypothetical protein